MALEGDSGISEDLRHLLLVASKTRKEWIGLLRGLIGILAKGEAPSLANVANRSLGILTEKEIQQALIVHGISVADVGLAEIKPRTEHALGDTHEEWAPSPLADERLAQAGPVQSAAKLVGEGDIADALGEDVARHKITELNVYILREEQRLMRQQATNVQDEDDFRASFESWAESALWRKSMWDDDLDTEPEETKYRIVLLDEDLSKGHDEKGLFVAEGVEQLKAHHFIDHATGEVVIATTMDYVEGLMGFIQTVAGVSRQDAMDIAAREIVGHEHDEAVLGKNHTQAVVREAEIPGALSYRVMYDFTQIPQHRRLERVHDTIGVMDEIEARTDLSEEERRHALEVAWRLKKYLVSFPQPGIPDTPLAYEFIRQLASIEVPLPPLPRLARDKRLGEPQISEATHIGGRSSQEDRYVNTTVDAGDFDHAKGRLMAVLDGHADEEVAAQAVEKISSFFADELRANHGDVNAAMQSTVARLVAHARQFYGGSTLSMVFIPDDENRAHAAVLGDSPILIVDKHRTLRLSPNHNTWVNPVEARAAVSRGADYDGRYISYPGGGGGYIMARALGDRGMDDVMSREPEIYDVKLGADSTVVVMTDGVLGFDYSTEMDFFALVKQARRRKNPADILVQSAVKKEGYVDNATAIVYVGAPLGMHGDVDWEVRWILEDARAMGPKSVPGVLNELKKLGAEALPGLVEGLSHPDRMIRNYAKMGLRQLGLGSALSVPVEILEFVGIFANFSNQVQVSALENTVFKDRSASEVVSEVRDVLEMYMSVGNDRGFERAISGMLDIRFSSEYFLYRSEWTGMVDEDTTVDEDKFQDLGIHSKIGMIMRRVLDPRELAERPVLQNRVLASLRKKLRSREDGYVAEGVARLLLSTFKDAEAIPIALDIVGEGPTDDYFSGPVDEENEETMQVNSLRVTLVKLLQDLDLGTYRSRAQQIAVRLLEGDWGDNTQDFPHKDEPVETFLMEAKRVLMEGKPGDFIKWQRERRIPSRSILDTELHERDQFRGNLLGFLSVLGPTEALEILSQALDYRMPDPVRRGAIDGLRRLNDDRVLEILEISSKYERLDDYVRLAAHAGLIRHGIEEGRTRLHNELDRGTYYVELWALILLRDVGNVEDLEVVEKYLVQPLHEDVESYLRNPEYDVERIELREVAANTKQAIEKRLSDSLPAPMPLEPDSPSDRPQGVSGSL